MPGQTKLNTRESLFKCTVLGKHKKKLSRPGKKRSAPDARTRNTAFNIFFFALAKGDTVGRKRQFKKFKIFSLSEKK